MGPIKPLDPNQSFQKLSSAPPPQVNATQQTGATTPTQANQSHGGKTQELTQSLSSDGSSAVPRQSASHDPVQENSNQDAKTLEKNMSTPENLEALSKKLNDADGNDTSQVRNQMLNEVKQSLGQDKAVQFMRKLSSTKMVPDPANPGKQIQQGKLYERMIQSYISDYKNAPPEKRAEALKNLTHLLADGAVKVLNDDDNC